MTLPASAAPVLPTAPLPNALGPGAGTPCFRFAPSPNGWLHLGHAFSALSNQRLAASSGGTLLLRIEDIDATRCRSDFETAMIEDLAWLGLDWPLPPLRQSTRHHAYAEALARLRALGVLYPCGCTRGDIARVVGTRPDWPRDPDGAPLYPGTCRNLPVSGVPGLASRPAWRLDMARALTLAGAPLGWTECGGGLHGSVQAADPAAWGDALLARRDIATSYHVAVVVDDAFQGVTNVVRGFDLFGATSLHRLLQDLLGLRAPVYHHHRLILDEAGQKLSKSRNAEALRTLRQAGVTPAMIRARFGL